MMLVRQIVLRTFFSSQCSRRIDNALKLQAACKSLQFNGILITYFCLGTFLVLSYFARTICHLPIIKVPSDRIHVSDVTSRPLKIVLKLLLSHKQ